MVAAVDVAKSITSVGDGSSVPYGPTNGYATPGGVTGYKGPAASSINPQTAWYVRAGGSNNNGGTTSSTSATRSGTDGSVTNLSTTFTSASAAFTSADIGQGICIQNGASTIYAKIVSITNSTTCVLSNPSSATTGSLSWAIGGAWATPAPALASGSLAFGTCGVHSGDVVYVGAGTYRAVYTVGNNYALLYNQPSQNSTQNPEWNFNGVVNFVGDVTGQYTGDAGMVQLTAYTTNDKTAPSATSLLNLNGKSNLAFSNIMFVQGNAFTVTMGGQNISFTDCAFNAANYFGTQPVFANPGGSPVLAGTSLNMLIDRCYIVSAAGGVMNMTAAVAGASDYDVNIVVRNCLVIASFPSNYIFRINPNATLSVGRPGGLKIHGCTALFFGSGPFLQAGTGSSNTSSVFPCVIYNSVLFAGQGPALQALTTGALIEDYNLISASIPRTSVAVGPHSVSDGSYAPLFHFGQERIWGGLQRMFGEPMAGSPLLGFGSDGAQTLYDLMAKPRVFFPAAVGALERSNTAVQATTPAPPSGTHVWQFTGGGYQDFQVPVDNTSTTISCYVQRDSNYYGTNPQLLLLANPAIGVAAQTVTDTGSAGQNNRLTLPAFTATANGTVTGLSVVAFSAFSFA
jgi:hypothetical protein